MVDANQIWVNPKEEFLELPFVISFPRTGTHWLNTMLELYFGKNRVIPNYQGTITFVNNLQSGYMWYSAHDEHLKLPAAKHELGTLYLYRDPVDMLNSLVKAHTAQPDLDEKELTEKELVEKWAVRYNNHLKRWLLDEEYAARTSISYEELKKDTLTGLRKAVEHFGFEFDEERGWEVTAQVTKERVHQRGQTVMGAYFGPQYLNKDYDNKRKSFRKKYADYIYKTVVTPELEPWFKK